jgi:hypothetical protein
VTRTLAALSLAAGVAAVMAGPAAHGDVSPRVDLKVLVVLDGGSPTAAIAAQLAVEGVPYATVDLTDPGRPPIDTAFLSDTVDGVPRAKYEAVVLPNESPFGGASPELDALVAYEQRFAVRQVDAYTWAHPAVGLNYAADPGYVGTLDGMTATPSPLGRVLMFPRLRGSIPFEDNAPGISETYGYLALPRETETTHFEPWLMMPIPGATGEGALMGTYTHDGREELVTTFAYNFAQRQFRLVGHAMVTWMTRGVHLGYQRNYFSVDVDDVFVADQRWSPAGHCTPGEDCGPGVPATTPIRMAAADVTYATGWEAAHGFRFDLLFNGAGSDDVVTDDGADPLLDAFVAAKDDFRWTNHTYTHDFLGCVQDLTVRPWRCVTDPGTGDVQWVGQAAIGQEITRNLTWAAAHGLPVVPGELVTGEHSGMAMLPQQPADNPNFGPALAAAGIAWTGADASRDPAQRQVGSALTVPRHPMNIFYNVSTTSEEVTEYNWIYDSAADGGSGLCTDHPDTMTCLAPLDPATGYPATIVPRETAIALGQILDNDPDPRFVHQSNLTGDRILYPALESVLAAYHDAFADNTPLVTVRLADAGAELHRQAAWRAAVAAGPVTAYLRDGHVTVQAPSGLDVPVTVPDGSRQVTPTGTVPFGDLYGGERSTYWHAGGSALDVAMPWAS